jgi:hypothetical protein
MDFLIMDPEQTIRDEIVAVIEDAGYFAAGAESGANGLGLLSDVRSQYPNERVVMTTETRRRNGPRKMCSPEGW